MTQAAGAGGSSGTPEPWNAAWQRWERGATQAKPTPKLQHQFPLYSDRSHEKRGLPYAATDGTAAAPDLLHHFLFKSRFLVKNSSFGFFFSPFLSF